MKKKEIRVGAGLISMVPNSLVPGRSELLHLIHKSGSIAKAAKSMGMSYKKAWAMVEEMNSRGTHPYVVTHKGGQKGGGTELTEAGKKMVAAYDRLSAKLEAVVLKESGLLKLV